MLDAALLFAALVANGVGLAGLALAMDVHWGQVQGEEEPLTPKQVRRLRMLGVLSLMLGLGLCLVVDHVSMAVLVWVMALAAAALAVTFTLTWRPRWLRCWPVRFVLRR
ncbi:DUF3325 domain-containing protein [Hylemonella sp. W303a]|uniref:DUF3325 domain-containing protein n=1 Tax=Hylemonella sp. W303a TaxID=3389873 RepID=UPI00396B1554